MCGCGNAAQSGPITPWVATPNDREAEVREFEDKALADQYVAVFGGGTVKPKQLEAAA